MGCLNYKLTVKEGMSASVGVVPTDGILAVISAQEPMSVHTSPSPALSASVVVLSDCITVRCAGVCDVGLKRTE
jgi:hypothetical protein